MSKNPLFQSVSLPLPTNVMAAGIAFAEAPFPIQDTMQSTCFDATQAIDCSAAGAAY